MLFPIIFSLLFSVFADGVTDVSSRADRITIVKMSDGKNYLVDVDNNGKVLTKYMEITYEVDIIFNLESEVAKARAKYQELKELEKDQIRFIAYGQLDDKLGDMARNHLDQLIDHYFNSYANQIVITLAKRKGNEEFLKIKEQKIVNYLSKNKVQTDDIEILYKWDRGEEATEFLKIRTTLKDLPAS